MLNANNVEYLLIGGYAVGYYGYVRATADMDVLIGSNPENAARAVAALHQFGFDVPELSVELFLKQESIVRLGELPFRIEIVTSISGVSFDECYRERIVDTIDGVEVPIISLRHLKINKKASGRFKYLADLEHLP
ncbi:MAG TPA: hypothetical protein VNN73_16920 [Blastocatellia bacterium]|nr:hypothetical protein [Blastocatellia bacterium]